MVVEENAKVIESLSRDDCLVLLEHHPARVGRVAPAGSRPDILPVNYVVDEGTVVFRTEEGKKLDAAVRGAFVAFEADAVDPDWEGGWSVLIRGWAEEVTDPAELDRLRALPLRPWAPGAKSHFVRIRPEVISGRRIT